MKIRLDFVTNSSSSCYVIAYKKIDNALLNALQAGSDSYFWGFMRFSSKDSFDKWFMDYYDCVIDALYDESFYLDNREDLKYLYEECIGYLNSGYQIFIRQVDYCDGLGAKIINARSEDFIIITEDA